MAAKNNWYSYKGMHKALRVDVLAIFGVVDSVNYTPENTTKCKQHFDTYQAVYLETFARLEHTFRMMGCWEYVEIR